MANKNLGYIIGIIIIIVIAAVVVEFANHMSVPPSIPSSTANYTTHYQHGIIYVNASATGVNATGSASKPFKTINQAMAFAKSGSVIVIAPGTYSGDVNITSKVILEGTDANTTIINATNQTNGIFVSGPSSDGTIITNLSIVNANNHAIYVQDADNVQILHNIVKNNGLNPTMCPPPPAKPTGPCIEEDKPIQLVGTSNVTVKDNTVMHNMADGGIGITDLGFINPGEGAAVHVFANATDNKIIENRVLYNKGGCGIVIASYNNGVMDNIVENNTVGFGVAGIVIATDTPNSVALNNRVENNTAFNNFIPGIIIHSNAPGDILSNTVVEFNNVSGNGNDTEVGALNKTGIIVSGDVMPIANTLIENNLVSNEYYGIWLRNANSTISKNNTYRNVTVPQPSA
jgi:parallel beta-helix repeat protein